MPNVPQSFDAPHGTLTAESLARILGRQWTVIAQVLNATLKIDTAANRSSTPFVDESLFYASDTGILSIGVDGVWQLLSGVTGTVTTTTTTPYTILATDETILIDATAGNKTVTVSQGTSYKGRIWSVKKIDASANTVTIDPATGNIDGVATKVLSAQWASATFTSDGTDYFIL